MTGALLVVMGGPGVGKDTLTQLLIARTPLRKFPSVTTRPMRPGERDGDPYIFVDRTTYDMMLVAGAFLSPVMEGGNLYGVPVDELERALARGERLLIHLTNDGVRKVRVRFPHVFVVLVRAPSAAEQRRRLHLRGVPDAAIEARIAHDESAHPDPALADLILVNETDRAEEAAERILAAWESFLRA